MQEQSSLRDAIEQLNEQNEINKQRRTCQLHKLYIERLEYYDFIPIPFFHLLFISIVPVSDDVV
jgi:hypothetical protein